MAPLHGSHWRRLIGASLLVLAASFLAPRWLPKPELEENRTLAARPPVPRDLAGLRAWPRAMDAYVSDNFPARAVLVESLNALRLKAGVSGSPKVIAGRDGWLFYDDGSHMASARNDPPYADDAAGRWLRDFAGRSEAAARQGALYMVVVGPDKETVYPQFGPAWYRGPDPNRPAALLGRLNAAARAGEFVYVQPQLVRRAGWGETVYSRHDTHWTGVGAYVAYAEILSRLHARDLTDAPRPLESFEDVAGADVFKPRNLAQMLGLGAVVRLDFPQFADPATEGRLRTQWLTERQDGTAPRVIDTGQTGKPVLLMTMDSFSTALLPFLYGHFSRVILSHHQEGRWREDLMARFHPDVVILEVVESGLPSIMEPAPEASEAARWRIARALAAPHRSADAAGAPRAAIMDGGPGPDRLLGSSGRDVMAGRAGDDLVVGGGGGDVLRGGQGGDTVQGGDGDDWISGDRGDDVLTGGGGADVFYATAGTGTDVVTDFSVGEGDAVRLGAETAYQVRQAGADTLVTFQEGALRLVGVTLAGLPPGWISNR